MKIAMFMEDERFYYVHKYLEKDHDVYIITIEDMKTIKDLDVLIMGIYGIREADIEWCNENFIKRQNKNFKMYMGNMQNDDLSKYCRSYLENINVVKQNSLYTAQGLLCEFLKMIQCDMTKISIQIIGYGNCGKAIKKVFTKIGCHVEVIERNPSDPTHINIQHVDHYASYIINTVDANVLNDRMLEVFGQEIIMLDIASSKPYESIKQLFKRYKHLPGLPRQHVNISAGYLLAKEIGRMLDEE